MAGAQPPKGDPLAGLLTRAERSGFTRVLDHGGAMLAR